MRGAPAKALGHLALLARDLAGAGIGPLGREPIGPGADCLKTQALSDACLIVKNVIAKSLHRGVLLGREMQNMNTKRPIRRNRRPPILRYDIALALPLGWMLPEMRKALLQGNHLRGGEPCGFAEGIQSQLGIGEGPVVGEPAVGISRGDVASGLALLAV